MIFIIYTSYTHWARDGLGLGWGWAGLGLRRVGSFGDNLRSGSPFPSEKFLFFSLGGRGRGAWSQVTLVMASVAQYNSQCELNSMPRYSLLQIARDQNTVRVNQSPSQDCRKNKKTNRVTGVLNNLSKNLDGSFLKHIWTLQVETPVDCNSSVNGTKQTIWHTKRINYMKLIFTTNTFKILEKGRDLHVLLQSLQKGWTIVSFGLMHSTIDKVFCWTKSANSSQLFSSKSNMFIGIHPMAQHSFKYIQIVHLQPGRVPEGFCSFSIQISKAVSILSTTRKMQHNTGTLITKDAASYTKRGAKIFQTIKWRRCSVAAQTVATSYSIGEKEIQHKSVLKLLS